ncbi:MAG: FtsX-like permease family protein [bacterium]|nr:FtsX-like permease family protein [bacterium]
MSPIIEKLISGIISSFADEDMKLSLLEYLENEYYAAKSEKGRIAAIFISLIRFLQALSSLISEKLTWSLAMFKNYLKIGFRNIKRHKGYSFINISGLAIGMTCSFILLTYIFSEFKYDSFHEKAENVYRLGVRSLMSGDEFTWFSTNFVIGETLKNDYPEVVDFFRFRYMARQAIKYRENNFYENRILLADNSIFNVLTLPFKHGSPETALEAPLTVVITEDMAQKYFGDINPIGEILRFNDQYNYTVTGVIYNLPENTDYPLNIICSMQTIYTLWGKDDLRLSDWISYNFSTMILLEDGYDYRDTEAKMNQLLDNKAGDQLRAKGFSSVLLLQPFTDIHLYTSSSGGQSGGAIEFVYIFSAISFFIILIACINFMNLSTARSFNRAREVGMRKVFGAPRKKLIKQFLSESLLLSFISLFIAMILVELTLPYISSLAGRELDISYLEFNWHIPAFIGITIVAGLLAGCYPALYLSSFKPVSVIKTGFRSSSNVSQFRSFLVVFQFTLSVILIIGTGLIMNQMDYMRNKDFGFDAENVVAIPLRSRETIKSIPTLKDELKSNPAVQSVGVSSGLPGWGAHYNDFIPEGYTRDNTQLMNDIQADAEFFESLGFRIEAGRPFSEEIISDKEKSVIINETAAKQFGWENAIGKTISRMGVTYTVVGVIKDYHVRSVFSLIRPTSMMNNINNPYNPPRVITVKINPENIEETIAYIRDTWEKIQPQLPFNYYFVDSDFDGQFNSIRQSISIFSNFTIVAIIIACLGLFGMASYTAEQRTKEIGIRKSLGASVKRIVVLLNRETVKLILISNIIAWPVTYFMLNRYLQAFPYREEVGVSTFIVSTSLVVLIALLTVAFQSIKAAVTNPIDSLRYE